MILEKKGGEDRISPPPPTIPSGAYAEWIPGRIAELRQPAQRRAGYPFAQRRCSRRPAVDLVKESVDLAGKGHTGDMRLPLGGSGDEPHRSNPVAFRENQVSHDLLGLVVRVRVTFASFFRHAIRDGSLLTFSVVACFGLLRMQSSRGLPERSMDKRE